MPNRVPQLGRRSPRRPTRPLRRYLHPTAAPAALLALRQATNDGIPPPLEDHSMGTLKDELTSEVGAYDRWATRRRFGPGGHNDRSLWVLACMGERVPVDEALGIHVDSPAGRGDAI